MCQQGYGLSKEKELNALNTKAGKVISMCSPNGVFAIAGNKPYILTTAAHQKQTQARLCVAIRPDVNYSWKNESAISSKPRKLS